MDVLISQPWGVVGGQVGLPPQPEVWWEGGRIVVSLCGEQDAGSAARVAEVLVSVAASRWGDVVVDLSGIRFMDAAIVGTLLDCRRTLRSQRRDLRFRAPSRFAERILDLCGLGELVDPPSSIPLMAQKVV